MFRRMLGPLPYCFLSLMVACSPAKPEESSGGGKDAGQGGTDSWLDEEGPCEELEDLRTQANPNSAVGDRCAMARLPRELRWIFHPDTWEFVPDSSDVQGEDAYLYGSRPGKVRMPKLAWKSCGNGCEKADLWTGIGRPIVGLGSVIVLPSFIPYSTQKKGFLLHKSVGAARGRSRWDGAPRVGNGLSQLSRTRASVYVPPSGCRMGRPSFSAVLSRSWRCSSRAPVKSSAWTRPLWGRAPTTANGSSGRNPCKANSSGFEAGLRTAEAFAPSCPRSMDEAFWSPSAGTASPASWVEASTRAGRPTTSGPSPVRRGAALGWGRCSGRA